jgi:hypothetical protein
MRISTTSVLACGLALSACSLYFELDPDEGPGGPGPDPCALAGPPELPGYPFDVPYYQQEIWPLTQRTCGFTGCHAAEGNGFGFRVWPDDGDACSMIQSFNELYANSDFADFPENSRILRAIDGSRLGHPLILVPGNPEYELLLWYITDAWSRLEFDTPAVYFDAYDNVGL